MLFAGWELRQSGTVHVKAVLTHGPFLPISRSRFKQIIANTDERQPILQPTTIITIIIIIMTTTMIMIMIMSSSRLFIPLSSSRLFKQTR